MISALRFLFVVAMVLALAGCRQPDGPMPVPEGEDLNRIEDLANNLQNVARGDPDGPRDLADDLAGLAGDNRDVEPLVTELAGHLASAFDGAPLSKEISLDLGEQLWLAVAARELSERQVEQLQADVQATLTSAGVDAAQAEPVAAQVAEVQAVVTERPRRWYQVF